jgi:hypothetical protein
MKIITPISFAEIINTNPAASQTVTHVESVIAAQWAIVVVLILR